MLYPETIDMIQHPAITMLTVWISCVLLYFLLPFEAVGFDFTVFGIFLFCVSIFFFIIGSLMLSTTSSAGNYKPCVNIDLGNSTKNNNSLKYCNSWCVH